MDHPGFDETGLSGSRSRPGIRPGWCFARRPSILLRWDGLDNPFLPVRTLLRGGYPHHAKLPTRRQSRLR